MKATKGQRALLWRYIIIVVLSIGVLGSEFYFVFIEARVSEQYIQIVNVAGKQRRFSQTIALQTFQYAHETSTDRREGYRQALSESLVAMRADYDWILETIFNQPSLNIPESVYNLYLGDEDEIDAQFDLYTKAVQRVLDASPDTLSPDHPDVQYILNQNLPFLALLNSAVEEFEQAHTQYTQRLIFFDFVVLGIGAFVILVFWWFVVHPLFNRLSMESSEKFLRTERLKAFFAQAFGSVFEINAEGVFLDMSDKFFKDYGFRKKDVIGKSFMDLLPEEVHEKNREAFQRIIQGEPLEGFSTYIRDAKGKLHRVTLNAGRIGEGDQLRVIGVIVDIDKRTRVERALLEVKRKYDLLVKKSGLMTYDYNLRTGAIAWAGAIFDLTGFTKSEYEKVGVDQWGEYIHPEDRESVMEELENAQNNLESFSVNYRFQQKNGSYRYVQDQGVFLSDKKGKARRMIGLMIDINPLKEASVELEQSQRQFKDAFQTAAIGFALVGLDGSWIEVNGALTSMLGYTKEELLKLTFQDITHPDDLESDLGQVKRMIAGEIQNYQMEKRYHHKDGHIVWVLLSVSMVRDENDKPLYFVSQIQNITEQKAYADRLQGLNDLKNTFIRTVSHQLRTPLNSIKWNLEALLGGDFGKLSDEQKDLVKLTHKVESNIARTLHDLLVILDIEEGRMKLEPEKVNLRSLVESEMVELESEAALKSITMKLQKPTTKLPTLRVDPAKLSDVINQLLRNAVFYTPEGGRITVTLRKNKDMLKLSVKDTGIGIPPESQDRVFERFYRAPNATKTVTDASGLGLSIAKAYVEAHKGKIGFMSKLKEGSAFWIELPLK